MYRPGELTVEESVMDPRKNERGESYVYAENVACLPHSCDVWVIGGPTQIRSLLEDLEAVLDGLYVPIEYEE